MVAQIFRHKGRIPFINFFGGFRTWHEIQKIDMPDDGEPGDGKLPGIESGIEYDTWLEFAGVRARADLSDKKVALMAGWKKYNGWCFSIVKPFD